MIGESPGTFIVLDGRLGTIIRDVESGFEELNINLAATMKEKIDGGKFDLTQTLRDSGLIPNVREKYIQAYDSAGIN